MNSLQKALVRHQLAASRVVTCSCRHLTALPPMPACNFKPQKYTGPSYEQVKQIRADNVSPGYLTYYKKPVLINQGHMQWLYDHQGTRYLDMFAGIVTVSVGHCHPKVVSALKTQSERLWHTTNIYMHPGIHEFAAKLASKMPGKLKVVYFVNSGSEANDMAMMLARLHTGRYDLITLRNAYHGMSPYLLGMTALSTWRYPLPSAFGIHPAMNADVYRGIWGGARCRDSPVQTTRSCSCFPGECQACNMYVNQLEELLKYDVPKAGIAGFFAESIQGVGGTVQFPSNYLKRVYELVRQSGGLCIADEVQTGFGRTGDHYWGFQGHGVVPDIVTMAKGIGNGFPLAAVVTTAEIAASLNKAIHFNTFGGNPLSCAVGSTVLDVIEEDRCQQVSKDVGTHYLLQLEKLRNDFPCVGDVRGKGLMLGLELVTDKASRKPMPAAEVNSIWEDCKDLGVLFGKGGLHGNVIRIKPPMCITKDDVNFAVAVLRHVLEKSQPK